MSLRGSLVLLAIGLALTGLNAALLLHREAARDPAGTAGRLFDTPPGRIRSIRIFAREEGGTLAPRASFEHPENGGAWTVSVPALGLHDLADARTVEDLAALVQLARLDPAGIPPAEAGLEDPLFQIAVDTGEGGEFVYLGSLDEEGTSRYAVHDRDPEAVQRISAELTRVLQRPPEEYRSLELFRLHDAMPERLVFDPGPGETPIVFELLPEGWMLRAPVRWPAAPSAMAYLLSSLQQMRAREVRPGTGEARAALGFDGEGPEVRMLVRGDEQVVRFGVDGPAYGTAWALREGRDSLFLVDSWLRDLVRRNDANRFRRRSLDLLRNTEPGQITIHRGEETLRLRRGRAGWEADGARSWPVDQTAVEETLLPALRNLTVQSFPGSGLSAEEAGLAPPAVRYTCAAADGQPLAEVALGVAPGGEIHARLPGAGEILQLRDEPATRRLLHPFAFWRERTLARFDPEAVSRVVIERPEGRRVYQPTTGTRWQLLEPETAPLGRDDADFAFLLFRLSLLDARYAVRDDVRQWDRFGLDHPTARVIVTLRFASDGAETAPPVALDLAIGGPVASGDESAAEAGEGVYARLAGSDTVYVIGDKLAGDIDRVYE